MKLMCKCSEGLFFNWIYVGKVKPILDTILQNTQYMYEIPIYGMKYRATILEFYRHYKIFLGNGLMTNRLYLLVEGGGPLRERRIQEDHLPAQGGRQGIFLVFFDEIFKFQGLIQKVPQQATEELEGWKEYLKSGLFPLLYKYIRGIYFRYSFKEGSLEDLLGETVALAEKLKEIRQDVLRVGLNMMETSQADVKLTRGRKFDKDEKTHPELRTLRNCISEIILMLESVYSADEVDYLRNRYIRHAALTATDSNPEPWVTFTSKIPEPAVSEELSKFRNIFSQFQVSKQQSLSKPPSENIFIRFLESKDSNNSSIVMFLSRICERIFEGLYTASATGSEQTQFNMDNGILTYLQSDILSSFTSFFANILELSDSFRENLYNCLTNEETKASCERFLSLVCFIHSLLSLIVMNKTFFDTEWHCVLGKFDRLNKFLVSLGNTNDEKFKSYISGFVPAIPGIPTFNDRTQALPFFTYVRLEISGASTDSCLNTSSTLEVSDRPEDNRVLINYMKIIKVFCSNCPKSQKQVYKYRTDIWFGIVRRVVDDMESNTYELKENCIDQILSLMEGNDPEVVKFFGSNTTFDIIIGLMSVLLKKLYVYFDIKKGGKPKYKQLWIEAEQLKKKSEEAEKEKLKQEEALVNQDPDYIDFYQPEDESPHNFKPENVEEQSEDFYNPRFITKEIMNLYTISSHRDIVDEYQKNAEFRDHRIMSIINKLNLFVHKFSSQVAGFKICLDNLNKQLLCKFGNDFPKELSRQMSSQELKPSSKCSETAVLYFAIMHIVKLRESVSQQTEAPEVKETDLLRKEISELKKMILTLEKSVAALKPAPEKEKPK